MSSNKDKKEKVKLTKEEKRAKRDKRVASCRPIKNFGWWFFGFISSFLITAGAAAICVCVIPSGTYFGNNTEYIDEKTGAETILSILMNYQNYSLGNFPVVSKLLQSTITKYGLDQYIEVDYDKLEQVSFADYDPNYIFENCIDVVATADSAGISSYLGDFANLKIMTENTEVTEIPDTSSSSFKAYMYYYKDDNGKLKRAYKDDNTLIPAAEGKTLYFPALRSIPLDELINVLPTRIGQAEVNDLLGVFTTFEEGSMLEKIFKGYTVDQMGSFNAEGIKLTDVLEATESNKTIYDILRSATNSETNDEITIGKISSADINRVKLADVLTPSDENESIYKILRGATGCETNEDITIGNLTSIDVNNVKLKDVLEPTEENKSVYDILLGATNSSSIDEITIGSLANIDANNIKLVDVIKPSEENKSVYDIFRGATGSSTNEEITVGSLSSINIDNVKLVDVIAQTEANKEVYDVLKDATGASSYDEITIGMVSNVNVDNIKLSTMLPYEGNETLYKILGAKTKDESDSLTIKSLSGFNVDSIVLSDAVTLDSKLMDVLVSGVSNSVTSETLTLGDLKTFSLDKVPLTKVLEKTADNQKLFDILASGTGVSESSLTIGSLSSFSIDRVPLSKVFDNDKLMDILVSGIPADKGVTSSTITLGNLSDFNIDNVPLNQVIEKTADNQKLFAILAKGTGVSEDSLRLGDLSNFSLNNVPLSLIIENTPENKTLIDILTQATGKSNYEEVTIANLNGLKLDNVKLNTIIDNESLLKLLVDAAGVSSTDDLTVGSLSSTTFDIKNMSLKTFFGDESTGNIVLDTILADDTVTVSNLGEKINNLSLYDAYGQQCFVTDSTNSVTPADHYKQITVNGKIGYEYDPTNTGEYYVSKKSGVMLLYAYTVEGNDTTNGRALKYLPSEHTYSELESGGTSLITQTTIYTLIASGMIEDNGYKDILKRMTVDDLLKFANNYASFIS